MHARKAAERDGAGCGPDLSAAVHAPFAPLGRNDGPAGDYVRICVPVARLFKTIIVLRAGRFVDFKETFCRITGHSPYPWQDRLYSRLIKGDVPDVLDIPTGLGKTSVILIWLIALSHASSSDHAVRVPRRLLYIVDRRVIVDQASELVGKIKRVIDGMNGTDSPVLTPYISTFRGGGGSADSRDWMRHPDKPSIVIGTVDMVGSRLFFSGYGLGGKIRPFYAGLMGQDSLIILDETHLSPALKRSLLDLQKISGCVPTKIYPPRVLLMSATIHTDEKQNVLSLDDSDLQRKAVCDRYDAKKTLELVDAGDSNLPDAIATEALKMTGRTIVYVQKPSVALAIAQKLRDADKAVATLTGTLRGFERDILTSGDDVKDVDSEASQPPKYTARDSSLDVDITSPSRVFAMFKSTSDVSRVPRYLVSTSAGEVGADLDADDMVSDISTFDSLVQRLGRVNRSGGRSSRAVVVYSDDAIKKNKGASERLCESLKFLKDLVADGPLSASPRNLSSIPDADTRPCILSPVPDTQPLTPDIVDMWSMTSLTELPARPAAHHWLRGHDKHQVPETHVAWRRDAGALARQDEGVIEDVLDHYPLLPHEMARDSTPNVRKILEKTTTKHAGLKAIIRRRDGTVRVKAIGEIADEDLYYSTLLLPCEAGGLNEDGMLAYSNRRVCDVADNDQYKSRRRIQVEVWSDGSVTLDGDQDGFDDGDDLGKWLAVHPDMKMSTAVVTSPADEMDYSAPSKELRYYVARSASQHSASSREQRLDDHHADVKAAAKSIVSNLRLDANLADAIVTAAEHHDLGKSHPHWQECMHGDADDPLAKTSSRRRPLSLGGFRHEFESVRKIADSLNGHPEKDLILHLIAAHHGWARPSFNLNATIDMADSEHLLVMKRYASLQKRFGAWGLAYLEGLLRGADWQASEKQEAGDQ